MQFDLLKRREFIALLGGAAAVWPLAVRAEPTGRIRRIAIVMPYTKGDPEFASRVQAFRQELAMLGWKEGANVEFDERWTTDNMDLVRSNAASVVDSNPDAIVAVGGRVVPVLMQKTRSIPIIVPGGGDPLAVGWVKSLARPGGNVTGFTSFELSVLGKGLEALKRIAPATARVAFVYNPDNPSAAFYRQRFETYAGPVGVKPITVPIHALADIERAATALAEQTNSAVFFAPDVTINLWRNEIIALMALHRLPAMYSDDFFVRSGGLAYYGTDRAEPYRGAAGYVDRVLRGEKVGDLPFQQPTKYHLIINLKTANALGLEISPMVLTLADEVIE
jgi:putative ABC transport system substrate-binding protein